MDISCLYEEHRYAEQDDIVADDDDELSHTTTTTNATINIYTSIVN